MDREVCVTWNEYQKKGKSIFRHLLESSEFADITLVSEDGQQFKGHKAILGSSCPFFEDLLRRNDHPHPLVHMFGVNSRELSVLLNFLYKGESSILQEDLQAFIVLARKLNLTGLTKTQDLREGVFSDAPKTKEADDVIRISPGNDLPNSKTEKPINGVVPLPVELRPERCKLGPRGEVKHGQKAARLEYEDAILDKKDARLEYEDEGLDRRDARLENENVALDFENIYIEPDQDTFLVSKPDKTKPNSDERSSTDKDESNDLGR